MTLVRTVLVWDRRAWSSLQPLHVASAENSVTPGPLPAPLDSLRAGAADNLALGRGTASAFSTLDSAAGSDRCVALRHLRSAARLAAYLPGTPCLPPLFALRSIPWYRDRVRWISGTPRTRPSAAPLSPPAPGVEP